MVPGAPAGADGERTIRRYVDVLSKRWRSVGLCACASGLPGLAVDLALPGTYGATAVVTGGRSCPRHPAARDRRRRGQRCDPC